MCRIAAVSGITNENRFRVWQFMVRLSTLMSQGNRHGLGYAAFDRKGNIFGEKWVKNHHAFQVMAKPGYHEYQSFGGNVLRDEATSIILHTRMATGSSVTLPNTHPFVDVPDKLDGPPNIALIHNGIIYNEQTLTKKFSDCDSETIMHEYINFGVKKDPKRLSEVYNRLEGWFACAVLTKNSFKEPILDIFTDGTSVHSIHVNELGVRIYCTSDYNLRQVCDDLKLTYKTMFKLKRNTYRRINAVTGEIIEKGDVEIIDTSARYNYESRNRGSKNYDPITGVYPNSSGDFIEDGWGNLIPFGGSNPRWSSVTDRREQRRKQAEEAFTKETGVKKTSYWDVLFKGNKS